MNPTRNTGRLAGAIYVLLAIVAPFGLLYVPRKLVVRMDPAVTASNIAGHEQLFRLGMLSELTSAVILVYLVVVLYRLFSHVDKTQAMLMVILGGIVSVPITFISVVNEAGALIVLTGPKFLAAAFNSDQLNALAMVFLRLRGQTILFNEIFWGLWLLPLAFLILRSRFIPRFIGIWLMVNGIAYVVTAVTGLLTPAYLGVVEQVAIIPELGEVVTMFWLLIMGAKVDAVPATA